jgi:hypothetical protein
LASLYQRWIKYGGKDYNLLEAVEIAYYGKTHLISPEMAVSQYQGIFKALLLKHQEATEEIESFPDIKEWSNGTMDTLFHTRKLSPAQAKAVGLMSGIYERQQELVKRTQWKAENLSREEAQQPPLTFDEWQSIPSFSVGIPRESWATGRMLQPGNYTTVCVETSKDPYYRKLTRMRHAFKDSIKKSEYKEPQSAADKDEEDNELFCKCSVCGVNSPESDMEHIWMHTSHKRPFWAWSARVRAREPNAEETTSPDASDTYKRKYNSLMTTLQKWSETPDASSAEIMKKMRALVKRRKVSETEWSIESPAITTK